jgi:hypothetical protein
MLEQHANQTRLSVHEPVMYRMQQHLVPRCISSSKSRSYHSVSKEKFGIYSKFGTLRVSFQLLPPNMAGIV